MLLIVHTSILKHNLAALSLRTEFFLIFTKLQKYLFSKLQKNIGIIEQFANCTSISQCETQVNVTRFPFTKHSFELQRLGTNGNAQPKLYVVFPRRFIGFKHT